MAFQFSKLTARVSLPKLSGLVREGGLPGFPRCPELPDLIKRYWSGCSCRSLVRSGAPGSPRRLVNTVRRAATSASRSSSKTRKRPTLVLFGLSAAVVASSVHSSAVCAMAARSEPDWEKEKRELLSMSREERRKKYKAYISLDEVPVYSHSGAAPDEAHYKPSNEINQKISLFRGDITKLEIDAIANAANKTLLGGGGVDGAIHSGAGPLLRKECSTLQGCETGEAKITGAYRLPAKYVIHTVGPIAHGPVGERERRALRDCYYNCLYTAIENKLRTVAFPCISTGVYGYPPEEAVEVALTTVREFLEEHHVKMDRVIFCVFLKSDEELYKKRLPAYFPQDASPKSKL